MPQKNSMMLRLRVLFVQILLLLTTVSSDGSCDGTSSGGSEYDPLDVLIIGAGWSGLAAANKLFTHDAPTPDNKFCVLEGRDSIGGRSRTMMGALAPDVPTELGSAWIYEGTHIADIFHDAGLVTNNTSRFKFKSRELFYEPWGGLIEKHSHREKTLMRRYKHFVNFVKDEATTYTTMQSLIDGYFRENPNLGKMARQTIEALLRGIIHSESGSFFKDANAEWLSHQLLPDYTLKFVAVPGGGYKFALDHFAQTFHPHIQLNTQVLEIDYTNTNINGVVKVTTLDTTTDHTTVHYARTVVSTVSTGVLQYGDLQFVPPLPDHKKKAIQDSSMGSINKCILYWDENAKDVTWWPDGMLEMQLIKDEDEDPQDWTYFINDQNHESNRNNHIMTAWIGGEASDRWESRTEEETKDHVLANLRKMYPQHSIPEPSNFVVTHWKSDPFARGAYSYFRVGVTPDEGREALAKPVEAKIFFAGEATWSQSAVGAYDSGEFVIDQILSSGSLF